MIKNTSILKPCAILIVLLLSYDLAFAFQQPEEWVKVDSAEGRFSASMPTKPQTDVRDVDTAVGKIALHTFGSSNKAGQYMLSYGDYPNAPVDAAQYQKVLDGVRDGVIKGLEAELISEVKVTLKGHPGRELRMTKMSEGVEIVFSWKMILVGRRLYQLGVATTKADAEVPDLRKFFDSFELVGQ